MRSERPSKVLTDVVCTSCIRFAIGVSVRAVFLTSDHSCTKAIGRAFVCVSVMSLYSQGCVSWQTADERFKHYIQRSGCVHIMVVRTSTRSVRDEMRCPCGTPRLLDKFPHTILDGREYLYSMHSPSLHCPLFYVHGCFGIFYTPDDMG